MAEKPGARVGRPRRGADVRPVISLRLDPALLEALDADAERRGESRTDWIEAAIRKRLGTTWPQRT
jgi:metal-responsive CopG/Arc/MetJ family transcriptional regulator